MKLDTNKWFELYRDAVLEVKYPWEIRGALLRRHGVREVPRDEWPVWLVLRDVTLGNRGGTMRMPAIALLESFRGRADGRYHTDPASASAYRNALMLYDTSSVAPEAFVSVVDATEAIDKEIAALRALGKGSKKGVYEIATWAHALRAHSRGRVHFHGKTLEEQADLVAKALAAAPTILGGVTV